MVIYTYKKSSRTSPISKRQKQVEKNAIGVNPFPYLPILIILFILAFAGSKFWERFRNDPSLDQAGVEAAQKEAETITKRHEVWVQYVLIADYTMQRPCLRCPNGVTVVTVKAGEIYKYGITTQGEARYAQKLYAHLGVTYFEEHEGTYLECKELEVNKISAYQFLPESSKPEVKLIRPPGNANRS